MKLKTCFAAGALLACGMAAGVAPSAPLASPAPAAEATAELAISAAAFMAGAWRSAGPGGTTEEHWSAPEGNNIMGMFRWLKPDGKPSMFEILTITEEEGGVFLRLRHFSATLVAKEDKASPMTLRLAEAGPDRAVFKAVEGEKSLAAITYERRPADTLHITVAFPDAGREPLRFELKRIGEK